jgi:hypothetical protein
MSGSNDNDTGGNNAGTGDNPPDAKARLAARVSGDDFFLGSVLADYQRRHNLDEAQLASLLGCPLAAMPSVRLCRRPGAAEPDRGAEQDVLDIARRFGIDPAALRRVIEDGR